MDWPLKLHIDQHIAVQDQVKASLLILFTVCLSIMIYLPGLGGSFLFDDISSLSLLEKINGVTNKQSALEFIFGNGTGPLGRPLSMATFLLNDQYWNGDPAGYKYTNLMLHILCGLLIIGFLSALLKNTKLDSSTKVYLPILVGAIWLIHPFNVSTTLYIIQRMTQLMSIFSLLALICFIAGRQLQQQNTIKSYLLMSLGVGCFGLLGIFSKENAASIIFYILVIEFTLFRSQSSDKYFKFWMTGFIYIPIGIMAIYFASHWSSYLGTYELRDFSLAERLLTECRILFDYIYHILIPNSAGTGVIHDDIVISKGLFSPVSTVFAVIGVIGIIAAAIKYADRAPHLSFGVLWFFSGHILESTFIPLELYFEHRNYLPMIGPLYSLCYYVFYFASKSNIKRPDRLPFVFAGLFILISSLFTYQSATIWGNSFDLLKIWAYEHPNSSRAQRLYGQALAKLGYSQQAVQHLSITYNKLNYDFSMPLAVSYIACDNNLANPYTKEQLLDFTRQARFSSSLIPNMKNLVTFSLDRGGCGSLSIDDVSDIVKASTNIDKLYPAAKADLYILLSQIAVKKGLLSPAIESLDSAFKEKKDPVILIRKAELLESAGLYQQALESLESAEKMINSKSIYKYSYSNKVIIEFFRNKIKSSVEQKELAS